MTSATRQRLPDPRVEHSRRAILRAALEEFAHAGYAGFRMDSVAERAGVGRSTVYRHWPDKYVLVADALQTLNVQPNPEADLAAGTARQRVELVLAHLVDVLTDSPFSECVASMVQAAENDAELRRFHHQYSAQRRRRLTEAISAGVASGEFPSRIDPEAASAALAGAMFYRRLFTDSPPDGDFVTVLVHTVLGG